MLVLMSNEDGRITQANKVYSLTKEYEEQLKDKSIDHVKLDHHSLISADRWMVNKDKNVDALVRRRPTMPVKIDKQVIKAGGNDSALILVPKQTVCTISGADSTIWRDVELPDGELELSIPLPMTYTITLRKWPFIDKVVKIEAVA